MSPLIGIENRKKMALARRSNMIVIPTTSLLLLFYSFRVVQCASPMGLGSRGDDLQHESGRSTEDMSAKQRTLDEVLNKNVIPSGFLKPSAIEALNQADKAFADEAKWRSGCSVDILDSLWQRLQASSSTGDDELSSKSRRLVERALSELDRLEDAKRLGEWAGTTTANLSQQTEMKKCNINVLLSLLQISGFKEALEREERKPVRNQIVKAIADGATGRQLFDMNLLLSDRLPDWILEAEPITHLFHKWASAMYIDFALKHDVKKTLHKITSKQWDKKLEEIRNAGRTTTTATSSKDFDFLERYNENVEEDVENHVPAYDAALVEQEAQKMQKIADTAEEWLEKTHPKPREIAGDMESYNGRANVDRVLWLALYVDPDSNLPDFPEFARTHFRKWVAGSDRFRDGPSPYFCWEMVRRMDATKRTLFLKADKQLYKRLRSSAALHVGEMDEKQAKSEFFKRNKVGEDWGL
ncbi:unnamed protein product [Amoebophrya sp. A25]|nr:unnamed protein product [Amoebophrya sp. A25]|eukprot:GSA25T00023509001.1